MYKLENGNLVKAPNAIHHIEEGVEMVTTNPTDEMLLDAGYKYLEVEEKPEITQYQLINEVLTESGNTITKSYEIVNKPIINDPEPQEMQEGYTLEDYEYVTATEVHRGKHLVEIIEENE